MTANVKAMMRWEEIDVARVTAEIPGTDPHLANQPLVVFAYYDAVSVVPALSPGAESSCGVATLLEIAEFLVGHPPRRKVKFIASPGHYQALSGVRDYAYKTIYPRRNGPDKAADQGTGEPYFFIGLDLSSRHNSLGAFFKGHFYDHPPADWENKEVDLQAAYSDYSSLLVEWTDEVSREGGPAETLRYQSGIVPQEGRDWRSLLPDLVAFDAEVVGLCGYPAITLATTGDPRNSVNTPLDTFERMEPFLANVRRQAIACAHIVKQTADVPVLPVQREDSWQHRKAASIFGFTIELSLLAYMPKTPVRNAITAVNMLAPDLGSKSKSMMGVWTQDFRLSSAQGLFEVFGLVEQKNFRVDGFLLSPSTGTVSKICKSEVVEATVRQRESDWAERKTDVRLNFFRAVCSAIFDLTDPLSLSTLDRSTVAQGESNSEFQEEYVVSFVGQESLSDPFSKPCAVFFTQRNRNVKFLLASTAVGYEGLLLNFEQEAEELKYRTKERTGTGYMADENENLLYLTSLKIVEDMHRLDGYRMDRLSSSGIYKVRVWDLYDRAERHIQEAREALKQRRYDAFSSQIRMAWGLENRVYPDVRDTSADVVTGVIFYFALLLPFVIFAERLLLNYVEIRKKLVAIFVLFVLSYIVLRLVHPAFQLSQTPVIILDGFFMLVAAVGTIWYLLAKFNVVMEHIRQKVDMIHRADVARASATMAAFVLGISNMRKRKVRTGLTAATLILLTFTILSFTSFETMPARMLEYAAPREAPYEGVLLRGLGWGPLSEFVTYDMMNFFQVRGMQVAPRSWFVNRKKTEELQVEVHRVGSEGEAVANAILGLSPEEGAFSNLNDPRFLRHQWFDRSMEDWPFVCIVPTRMMESLRIEDSEVGEATISVLGRRLRVVGVFNSGELFSY
ncbi:MAG: M28 family peptidase, partial [Planctomycetota bacterium]